LKAQAEEDSAFVDLFIHPSVATGLSEFLQTHHLEKRVLVHDFAE
jgi:hypothetical protein